jgi:hypothetical protein
VTLLCRRRGSRVRARVAAAHVGAALSDPNGLLVYRDEIVSLLSSLDQEERASEKGFYLTGWNGDSSYTFDRIGRGLHLNVECVCISMLGSTQPGRISDYLSQAVRGGRGDDGVIQRFGLLVWPDGEAATGLRKHQLRENVPQTFHFSALKKQNNMAREFVAIATNVDRPNA